jgi:hypothetical protein
MLILIKTTICPLQLRNTAFTCCSHWLEIELQVVLKVHSFKRKHLLDDVDKGNLEPLPIHLSVCNKSDGC